MTSRRGVLRGITAACLGTTAVAGGATAAVAPQGIERVPPARGARRDRDRGATAAVLRERGTASYDADARRFRFAYGYAIPDNVERLTVVVPGLGSDTTSVHAASGFERTDERTFRWDGGPDPALTVDRRVETGVYATNGYVAGDSAFAATVGTEVGWRYREPSPGFERSMAFDGEGRAATGWSYAGPFEATQRSTDRTTYAVVVPAGVDDDVDPEGILALYAFADARFPSLLNHDAVDLFVVPADRLAEGVPAGRTSGNSVLLDAASAAVDAVGNVPAHEYVHAQWGGLADGAMTWFVEGSAEYYGAVVSLNAGVGTVAAFLAHVRTDEYGDAVLAEVRAADDTRADYRKGAHVCAALDAEIQRRSGGEGTLLSVVTSGDHDVGSYDGFEAAVVAAAGDDAMADWLDRHVRGAALPEVPADRRFYTLGDADPSALPTATPTRTPSRTAAATPTPSTPASPVATSTPESGVTPTTTPGTEALPVATPGFGPAAAGAGVVLAALLARRRGRSGDDGLGGGGRRSGDDGSGGGGRRSGDDDRGL